MSIPCYHITNTGSGSILSTVDSHTSEAPYMAKKSLKLKYLPEIP
jgi:hypothetical protein